MNSKAKRTTIAPKRQRDRFLVKAKLLLLQLGAQQEKDEFVLETRVGRLSLHPDENQTIGLGTVFARFDNPDAARQLVDCNPFSGKWNFHYFNGWTVETAIGNLLSRLQDVLA